MEPEALAGMIFTLVVLAMIGGFILLFPLTRQLGHFMRGRLERGNGDSVGSAEMAQLRSAVSALETQVEALAERQEFMEKLIDQRGTAALPGGRVAGEDGAVG